MIQPGSPCAPAQIAAIAMKSVPEPTEINTTKSMVAAIPPTDSTMASDHNNGPCSVAARVRWPMSSEVTPKRQKKRRPCPCQAKGRRVSRRTEYTMRRKPVQAHQSIPNWCRAIHRCRWMQAAERGSIHRKCRLFSSHVSICELALMMPGRQCRMRLTSENAFSGAPVHVLVTCRPGGAVRTRSRTGNHCRIDHTTLRFVGLQYSRRAKNALPMSTSCRIRSR